MSCINQSCTPQRSVAIQGCMVKSRFRFVRICHIQSMYVVIHPQCSWSVQSRLTLGDTVDQPGQPCRHTSPMRSVSSVTSDSWRHCRLQPARLLCPRASPGRNTGVGCHFLLHPCVTLQKQLLQKLGKLHINREYMLNENNQKQESDSECLAHL